MRNLGDIRHSMRAIGDTRQITDAMRLISISKMQKALVRYDANRLHFNRVQSAMKDILLHSPDITHPFMEDSDDGGGIHAYIVIAADKGLCGGYNHNLLRFATDIISKNEKKLVITVGQETRLWFQRIKIDIDVEYLTIAQNPSLDSASRLTDDLTQLFLAGGISEISVIYTKFISSFKQEPRMLRMLPVQHKNFDNVEQEFVYTAQMTYAPSIEEVFDSLVPQYVTGLLYGALVQSFASEQCARMMAMENATKSADEMLQKLEMELNRARQAAITAEISEIVAAMDALS